MSQGPQRNRAGAASLFDVFIHLHVLHAASKEGVSAEQLIEFLARRW